MTPPVRRSKSTQLPAVTRAVRKTRLWFAAARPIDTMDSLQRLYRTRAEVMAAYGDDPEFSILRVTRAEARNIMVNHNAAVLASRSGEECQSCGAPCECSPCDDCMAQLYEDELTRQWEEHCQRLDALPPYAAWVETLGQRVRSWYERQAAVITIS